MRRLFLAFSFASTLSARIAARLTIRALRGRAVSV
jgi:hypothetical protein